MGRHVSVNRLEVFKVTREALNTTYKCQASNTKLVPPVERSVRLEMLRKCRPVDGQWVPATTNSQPSSPSTFPPTRSEAALCKY